ncbi:MAG TPA: hypothetical protein PKA27_03850 [Fimbriimonadaceae bacterium]|nr:hypothetical protein [Fimbriimonadaceae bacterium]
MTEPAHFRRFTLWFALGFAALSLVPFIFGLINTPAGARYTGFQLNADDHMVYAAWMRQAMEGQFLFDNRFAVDPQPGLTFHAYFLVLGWIAKVFGIGWAATLSKAVFTGLFTILLGRLIERLSKDAFTAKLCLAISTIGAGIGFLVWHDFGQVLVRPSTLWLSKVAQGRLPIDTWQPEAFVMPSALTNSLFMVSLCLIVGVFLCVLGSRSSWRPVLPGVLCTAALMNIHSYDVLLVGLVLVGTLVGLVGAGAASKDWVIRCLVIALGAVPAAVWFVIVLRNDEVFQARAATPTYSPMFVQVLLGCLPILIAALIWLGLSNRRLALAVGAGLLLLAAIPGARDGAYWLSAPMWLGLFVLALLACYALGRTVREQEDQAPKCLLFAWFVIGLIAPYFPALFQRKLLMGIAIPIGVLAGLGLAVLLMRGERSKRNLATIMVITLLSATPMRWLMREQMLARDNVSSTTVHPVYLSSDSQSIVDRLNEIDGRKVVLALPGIRQEAQTPDAFLTPYLPDLNPFLSGFAGCYTVAGHWSETPNYLARRDEATKFFLRNTTEVERTQLLARYKIDYVVAPVPDAFPALGDLADLRGIGEPLAGGSQFVLLKVRPK